MIYPQSVYMDFAGYSVSRCQLIYKHYHIFTKKSIYRTLVQMKKIQVITLFPEMFEGVLNTSMMWKAQQEKAVEFRSIPLREFGLGPRKQVDDTPYGGGDGMLLKPEPIVAAIKQAKKNDPDAHVILPSPRGKSYRQSDAKRLAADDRGMIVVCPRYE